jgi:predicted RNase H-like nuclease (RuvC/YqgF family)
MYGQNVIPPEFLKSFDYDVQELINNTVKMNQAVDRLTAELKKALAEQERVRTLESTIRNLEGDLKDWKERSQNAEKTLASIAGRSDEDMRTIQVCNILISCSLEWKSN